MRGDRATFIAAALGLGLAIAGCSAPQSEGPSALAGPEGAGPSGQVNRGAESATPTAPTGGPAVPGYSTPSSEGFGMTKARAVQVCMPAGERQYLAALRCPDGSVPEFARRGNVGPRNPGGSDEDMMLMMDANAVLPPGMVDAHIVDLYDVRCGDGTTVEVYMDMYHCADPDPVQAVGPLLPARTPEAPPGSI